MYRHQSRPLFSAFGQVRGKSKLELNQDQIGLLSFRATVPIALGLTGGVAIYRGDFYASRSRP